MLDCKRNRLDYGELLRPPVGHRLDQGIAATYSADLGTLLSIPVALVYAQTLEDDLTATRFQLLEAIKQFSRQVKVYHQKGQLHVPAKLNWLHAYLEDVLVPILPDDAFTAFHPKVWILRYTATDDDAKNSGHPEAPEATSDSGTPPTYRILVLSRNLTFDRSWDVAACLEGQPRRRLVAANRPVLDFVRWLDAASPIPKATRLVEELARVHFSTPPPFESHAFHPVGIPGHKDNPVIRQSARRALAMSPFLHPEALRQIRQTCSSDIHLFSERRELQTIPVDLLKEFRCHQLNELIVDGERLENAEDGSADVQSQHLHAKLFLFEGCDDDSEGSSRCFLGSANATLAALSKNVEFLLELRGGSPATRLRPRLRELVGEDDGAGPFVAFKLEEAGRDDSEERRQQQEDRLFEHALLRAPIEAWVEPVESGQNYNLRLELNLADVPQRSGLSLTVQPFTLGRGTKPHRLAPGRRESCLFPNLAEVELSRFLHFRIERKGSEAAQQFLCRIEIEGLPEDRLENILRKIIDSSDKFFDYLRFLLADEVTKEDLLASMEEESAGSGANQDETEDGWRTQLPIFERLLVTASRSPGKLADIDEIVRHLANREASGDDVVPEAFLSFWEAFRPFIPERASATPSASSRPPRF
jgi:hypothetical protein